MKNTIILNEVHYEWCGYCECDVEMNEFKIHICPDCGAKVLPCGVCEINCDGDCPFSNK